MILFIITITIIRRIYVCQTFSLFSYAAKTFPTAKKTKQLKKQYPKRKVAKRKVIVSEKMMPWTTILPPANPNAPDNAKRMLKLFFMKDFMFGFETILQ